MDKKVVSGMMLTLFLAFMLSIWAQSIAAQPPTGWVYIRTITLSPTTPVPDYLSEICNYGRTFCIRRQGPDFGSEMVLFLDSASNEWKEFRGLLYDNIWHVYRGDVLDNWDGDDNLQLEALADGREYYVQIYTHEWGDSGAYWDWVRVRRYTSEEQNMTVREETTQIQYTLTIIIDPIGSGSVNLNDTGPYSYGDVVELTAVPKAGWTFSSWSGDLSGSDNPDTVTMDDNKFITAHFLPVEEEVPLWMQWWLWTIVLVVIVALAGAVYFLKKRKTPKPQDNFHFSFQLISFSILLRCQ